MRRLGWILLFLASCRQEQRPSPAPPTNPGLKTRLIPLGDEFAVGKPLAFRLELKNESGWPMIYDSQGVDRGFLLTGPDGKPVEDVDIPRQTTGHHMLLRPGETVVLSEEFDFAPEYLIVLPGRYQAQFAGGGLSVIDAREVPLLALLAAGKEPTSDVHDQFFDEIDKLIASPILVPSNTVTLDLKPGRAAESVLLAERLQTILPEDWSLGISNLAKEGETLILLQKLTGLKSETATVRVVCSGGSVEKMGERVCVWGGRNIYALAEPKAAKLWPDYRAKVAKALAP